MQRKRYLKKSSLEEAQQIFINYPGIYQFEKVEELSTRDSLGRITAEPVFARISSPFYHCSAMDGTAVRASDTFKASTATPVRLGKGQFCIIDTGDPIPPEFDAVIMIEEVTAVDDATIEITSAVAPWQDVRMAGEDIVATELILARGHIIRPVDIAAMLSAGVNSVIVKKKPLVAIIPTGDEIIEPGDEISEGEIIDSNSYMLEALVKEWGGEPKRLDIVKDVYEEIKKSIINAAAESDIVLTSAGSSAGRGDFVPPAIEELGKLLVHGIGISPGKPTALGVVNNTPILGLPGYPVSMTIAAENFLKPLICKMLGLATPQPDKIIASVQRKVASKLGSEEFVRVKLNYTEDGIIATPLSRGASVLNSMVRADGIMRIPSNSEGLSSGDKIQVELIRNLDEIKNSIMIIGSHDITLDILADEAKKYNPDISISSVHLGSLGGLMALKRHESHIAGTHLLDEETGQYNLSYINRLLPERKISLINLVYRQQGLIVKKGNPENIKGLSDLLERKLTFCNRQRGSGTRILLDYELKKLGIEGENIKGYDREVYTHLAVASAVETGMANAGLGIFAAAKALDLDFVPIAEERYDLAIPDEFLSNQGISLIIDILAKEDFQKRIKDLGGYDTRDMGKRMSSSS